MIDYQLWAVVAIITGATCFWLIRGWRSLQQRGKSGCGSGCGSCGVPVKNQAGQGLIQANEMIGRLRKRVSPGSE